MNSQELAGIGTVYEVPIGIRSADHCIADNRHCPQKVIDDGLTVLMTSLWSGLYTSRCAVEWPMHIYPRTMVLLCNGEMYMYTIDAFPVFTPYV